MRILFLGDVIGRAGREATATALPGLRAALGIDLAVVNGENASHGFGLGPDMADALFAAGADVITLGNHAWDRKEIIPYINNQPRLVRPLNVPPGTPGLGSVVATLHDGSLYAQSLAEKFGDLWKAAGGQIVCGHLHLGRVDVAGQGIDIDKDRRGPFVEDHIGRGHK